MAYPNPTTYTLPFGDKIRVSSRRRFILVRDTTRKGEIEGKPFIYKRSDVPGALELRYYRPSTDYIIDQLNRTITFHFNGRKETTNLIVKVRIPTSELNRIARGES
jgi:hypothetical protein